jgi:hypothetical protein
VVKLLRQIELWCDREVDRPHLPRRAFVEQTYYRWRKQYGGLQVDGRRLKDLERENAKPRRLVSELSLEKLVLKDIMSRNF